MLAVHGCDPGAAVCPPATLATGGGGLCSSTVAHCCSPSRVEKPPDRTSVGTSVSRRRHSTPTSSRCLHLYNGSLVLSLVHYRLPVAGSPGRGGTIDQTVFTSIAHNIVDPYRPFSGPKRGLGVDLDPPGVSQHCADHPALLLSKAEACCQKDVQKRGIRGFAI